jgi:hypothetical protein
MKIVYDVSKADVVRIDAIVITTREFPGRSSEMKLAFRGDDRPPSDIFKSGFKKYTPSYQVWGAAKLLSGPEKKDTITWDQVMGKPEWTQTMKRKTIVRNEKYDLLADELLFRPNYLDLLKETCISLSLDFELVTGFPLKDTPSTYSYILKPADKVLPTYKIQNDGGNYGLAKSMEVTCNSIPGDDIIGAAEVNRTKKGSDSMCEVTYKIVKWWQNLGGAAVEDSTGYLIKEVEEFLKRKITLAGEKKVCAGLKCTGSTASNAEKQPTDHGPKGCVENGPAAALLVGYVSIWICALLAPCRRPILNATMSSLYARRCTSKSSLAVMFVTGNLYAFPEMIPPSSGSDRLQGLLG